MCVRVRERTDEEALPAFHEARHRPAPLALVPPGLGVGHGLALQDLPIRVTPSHSESFRVNMPSQYESLRVTPSHHTESPLRVTAS